VSTSAEQFTGHQMQIHERRSHVRVLPRTLIYVACGESNGGMVLNVSEDGIAVSMAIPVGDEAYSNLHVRMNGLAHSVEIHGRMAWTTKSKKRAGIQLVDVSDEQRGQIREWLAQEGVRDINLLPRVSEPAASILPVFAGDAFRPRLRDEQRTNPSLVAASAAIPEVLAEPCASLLTGFGSTAPEFLGPAQAEPPFAEDSIAETGYSQAPNPNFVGFRENEWDLASVTMVPRKRSKPEGLSALGLLLLWIAIPSFGIGIIVGRRPLQHWLLSRGESPRKNISPVAAPEPQVVNVRDESSDITSSDIDASGAQSISTRRVEAPPIASSQDVKTPAATKSFVSTPAFVDNKLLNSMSTQELRALKSPASIASHPNPNAVSKVDSNAKLNAVAKNLFSSSAPVVKPVTRTNIFAASTNVPTNAGNSSARSGESKGKSAVAPATSHDTQSIAVNTEATRVQGFSKQNPGDQVARTNAVDSGTNTTNYPGRSSNSTVAVSTSPSTENSVTHQNTSGASTVIRSVGNGSTSSTASVNHSVTPLSGTAGNARATSASESDASRNGNSPMTASKTEPPTASSSSATPSGFVAPRPAGIASDATPRIAPNVRTSMAPGTDGTAVNAAPSSYASASSRPAPPSSSSNFAPVNAQSPLHGVMLVARKSNEPFLLRLPVESVAGGRSVSVVMQRFVMVPAESRWHHHGPIAKLMIGELLTQVAASQVETASNARPGDAVTVRALVDKNGSVQDLKPVSGRFALMPRVMQEVRDWQFDQTLIDGKPVESEVAITFEFGSGSVPQPSRGRKIQARSFKP
jgi:hypothetical protein